MLPETDRSNLAYDLSMYDNAARREQEREQERERERRARQIKMNKHSVSRSGSKLKLFAVTAVALGALWAVNVQFTKVDDIARKVEDQREHGKPYRGHSGEQRKHFQRRCRLVR